MPITALPEAPNKSTDSASSFNTKANAWVAALGDFVTEANALETNVNSRETLATAAALTATTKAAEALASASSAEVSAASALSAPGTNASSTSSLTFGTGSKSLTIQTGKSFVIGMHVVIASSASPDQFMYGPITSYDSGTGALTFLSEFHVGSGSLSSWVVSLSGPKAASVVPPSTVDITGGIAGMVLYNYGGDVDHDITVTIGSCLDNTGRYQLTLSSPMTKRLDATWAAGDGNGGMLTGSIAASTSYDMFAIFNPTTRVTDVGFVPVISNIILCLPSGYTAYRRLGFVITDSSANIRNFYMVGNDLVFQNAFEILTNVNTSGLTWKSLSPYIVGGRVETITIGANDHSAGGLAGVSRSSTEAQYWIAVPTGTDWNAIMAQDVLGRAVATVHPDVSGGIYINTNSVSIDVWLKAVKLIR